MDGLQTDHLYKKKYKNKNYKEIEFKRHLIITRKLFKFRENIPIPVRAN